MTDPMTPERLAEIEARYTRPGRIYTETKIADMGWRALDDVPDLLAEVRRLQAVIERVRALHRRRLYWPSPRSSPEDMHEPVCSHCVTEGGGAHDWPCPTIAALDGES